MSVTSLPQFEDKDLQACPLCTEKHPILIKGLVDKGEHIEVTEDKGYSFCNCSNIFYTGSVLWNELDAIYDKDYAKKYEPYAKLFFNIANKYIKVFSELGVDGGRMIDIGPASTVVMGAFAGAGYETACLDFVEHPIENSYVGNYEKLMPSVLVDKGLYDVVWMSHIFEHFFNPSLAVMKLRYIMKTGGLVFIAMPDPWQIDWREPYSWRHWWVNEHHILWDMDSFIKYVEAYGFECVHRLHNCTDKFMTNGDYHLIFRRVK